MRFKKYYFLAVLLQQHKQVATGNLPRDRSKLEKARIPPLWSSREKQAAVQPPRLEIAELTTASQHSPSRSEEFPSSR